MCHAASARRSSALRLAGPVVSSQLRTAAETGVSSLLLVPVGLATDSAQRVSFVVTFSLCLGTGSLQSVRRDVRCE